ncbi:isoleucyl-tRNA synthetase [Actinobacillus equuli]|nr:isoleucyl-tRNA synthetase [Actinobacillus equuli]
MAGLVANDGKFISTTPFFAGLGVFDSNEKF